MQRILKQFLVLTLILVLALGLVTACKPKPAGLVGVWAVKTGNSGLVGYDFVKQYGLKTEDVTFEFTADGELIIRLKDATLFDFMVDSVFKPMLQASPDFDLEAFKKDSYMRMHYVNEAGEDAKEGTLKVSMESKLAVANGEPQMASQDYEMNFSIDGDLLKLIEGEDETILKRVK